MSAHDLPDWYARQQADTHEVSVKIVHRTEKAVLVNDGGDADYWLPLSRIELDEERDGTWTLRMPQRLAEEKGMV